MLIDNTFFGITNYGMKFADVIDSFVDITDNSFEAIGVAGLEFFIPTLGTGQVENSQITIAGNSFTSSPAAFAFWDQENPLIDSFVKVSNNIFVGTVNGAIAGAYVIGDGIDTSVLKFYDNSIRSTTGGITATGEIENSTIVVSGNTFDQVQNGFSVADTSLLNCSIICENNSMTNFSNAATSIPVPPTGITIAADITSSEFTFEGNYINPGLSTAWGIAVANFSAPIVDSSFVIEDNYITSGDIGIRFAPLPTSSSTLTIDNGRFISLTENLIENMTTGILFYEVVYTGSSPALLRIKENCIQNVLDGIDISFENAIISSTPTANISENCFNNVSGISLFLNAPGSSMTIKVNGNETFNFVGSGNDFLLQNLFADIEVLGNSLNGPFYLEGGHCLSLFGNTARGFTLHGFSLSVESPNGQLSGVQKENHGTISPSGVTYVPPGTCSP